MGEVLLDLSVEECQKTDEPPSREESSQLQLYARRLNAMGPSMPIEGRHVLEELWTEVQFFRAQQNTQDTRGEEALPEYHSHSSGPAGE